MAHAGCLLPRLLALGSQEGGPLETLRPHTAPGPAACRSAGPERSVLLWPPKGNINCKIGELAGHSAGVVQVVIADERSQVGCCSLQRFQPGGSCACTFRGSSRWTYMISMQERRLRMRAQPPLLCCLLNTHMLSMPC